MFPTWCCKNSALHLRQQKRNNGNELKGQQRHPLNEGDSVTLTKDLKVKGSSLTLKRGKVVKNIKLTSHEDEIEGRVDGSHIVLKTIYLKKA
ncbi:MAG: alkylphosphonate utilization protein [Chryseosolibacter sp.]